MTSFIGYIDNAVIKLLIYFNSHMRLDEQIITSFLSKFMYSYRTVVHTNIKILELLPDIFLEKYLRQPSIDFDDSNLSSSGDVTYFQDSHVHLLRRNNQYDCHISTMMVYTCHSSYIQNGCNHKNSQFLHSKWLQS